MFLEHMRQTELKIPFLEAIEQMSQYDKYLKGLFNKKKLEDEVVILLEEVSAIVQGIYQEKKRQ